MNVYHQLSMSYFGGYLPEKNITVNPLISVNLSAIFPVNFCFSIKDAITYYSLRFISRMISLLPRKLSLRAGGFLGSLVSVFYPIRKKVSEKNIRIAFPGFNGEKIKSLSDKLFVHYGKVLFDLMRIPYLSRKNLQKMVSVTGPAEKILSRYDNGIILTAHFGNWEMIPSIFSMNGKMVYAIARAQKNAGSDRFFTWLRESVGCRIIYNRDSTRKMLTALNNGFLVLASDQYGGKRGVPIRFFGKETQSPKGAAVFHIKTGVPIFFCMVTMNDSNGYSFHLEELILTDGSDDMEENIRMINQKYHDMLEKWICQVPHQYFWFHRKWR